jgi:lysophospholipase L1-like esterase
MLKYLNPTKLCQNLRKSVLVRTFPGAKVTDMKHYVQPTLATSPETLVLHVGTNDLSQKTTQNVLEELTSLGQAISVDSPETKLVISAIITRADNPNLATQVSEINAKLPQVCITNNWGFISHENIDGTHLNTSGVHLNKQGTVIMAQNIRNFFKHSN